MAERLTHSREFGDSLDDWGRVVESESALGSGGSWVRATGDLIRGELDRTQLDLISIDAKRHVVSRTVGHIARAPGPRHIIPVQLRGRSVLTPTDGTDSLSLDAGDVGYWTSDLPYQWEFDGPFTLLMLRAPFAAVDLAPSALRPLAGRSFASDQGFARLVVPFAEDILRDPSLLVGQSGTRIVQNIVSLFTTMLVGELDLAAVRDRSGPAYRRVIEYIAEHLAESLDLRRIADDNDMSTRYLQSLFQERGTSVSQWIRSRRVESARQALADPALASAGVSQIAADNGFSDHAHFTRTFRATFNETPTQWRGRALGVPDSELSAE
jgi:AraC-like DNA-binding protein